MSTHKTYEVYKARCKIVFKEKEDELEKARALVRQLELDLASINGQIITLETLMNVEENPPIVELPFSGERPIEEMYDTRLDGPMGANYETIRKGRQEGAYLTEAMDSVEYLDAANRKAEASEGS